MADIPHHDPLRRLLIVSATALEAEPVTSEIVQPAQQAHGPWTATVGRLAGVDVAVAPLGVGKSATAAGLATLVSRWQPTAVVQLGIGGTYAGSFLAVGGVAVARTDVDLDVGVTEVDRWQGVEALGFGLIPGSDAPPSNRMPTDPDLTSWLSHDGRVPVVAFGTSDAVSGDLDIAARRRDLFELSVESMEGAAAAQTARALGLPFAEVRGVSNVAGQRDKASWEVRAAVRASASVLLGALRSRI